MNYDVILRSDVKKALVAAPWISVATKAAVWSILDNVPIVDAQEILFQNTVSDCIRANTNP